MNKKVISGLDSKNYVFGFEKDLAIGIWRDNHSKAAFLLYPPIQDYPVICQRNGQAPEQNVHTLHHMMGSRRFHLKQEMITLLELVEKSIGSARAHLLKQLFEQIKSRKRELKESEFEEFLMPCYAHGEM